jgi:hypothetical protein
MVEVGGHVATIDQEVIGVRGQGVEEEGRGEGEEMRGRVGEGEIAARGMAVSYSLPNSGLFEQSRSYEGVGT